jgi:hypothetical protein
MFTVLAAAAVLPVRTVSVPRARSTSRHRSASASPILSPANVSVATSALRCPARVLAAASSAEAPARSAATCSARSSHVRDGARFGRRCLRPFATLRRTSSYSTACSRIAESTASVLLIDVALSFPTLTFASL